MIKKPRNLLWFIPLCLFVTSPFWEPVASQFLAPRGNFKHSDSITPVLESQHFTMDTVSITLTSNGKKEWQINADRAYTGTSDRDIEMEKVKARYIGKDKPPTHIDSQKGHYFIDDRHLLLIDNVVISRPLSREVMYTQLLHYYDENKMAISPGHVELEGPSFQLEAGRMDYDLSTDGYDFSEGVQVNL